MQTDWRGAQNIAGAGGGGFIILVSTESQLFFLSKYPEPSPASPAPVLQSQWQQVVTYRESV